MSRIKEQLQNLKIDRSTPVEQPARRWLALAAVTLLLLLGTGGWWLSRPDAAPVRTVEAREARIGDQQTVLNASGYVTARRQATVSSKITGKVVEVLIEEGMAVREGQVLARLDASNVGSELQLAEAQLAAARSELEETRVRLAEARLELRRVERLVAGSISSEAELDAARAGVDSLGARLVSQEKAAEVAEHRVAVDRQHLEDTVIRAPFAGIVVAKNAQPGEMISPVSAGGGFTRTGIGTIVDMDSLEIEVDVNEAYINRVEPGQRVEATLDSYPDWRIPSTVIAIIPTADRQTATVKVRIAFDELDSRILPDMGVKVAFQSVEQTPRAAAAVAVPRRAIRKDGEQDVVLVVAEDRVERRAVRLGDAAGEEAVVLTGLAAGESVVLEGPADLRDGDRIEEKSR